MAAAYNEHKQAVRPLLSLLGHTPGEFDPSFKIPEQFSHEFIAFILQQGLAGHRYELLGRQEDRNTSQEEACKLFRDHVKGSALAYLDQLKTLRRLHSLFSKHRNTYAVYKGTHVREVLYTPPALRDAVDIDLLIAPGERTKAVEILVREGFTPEFKPENTSVEASLKSGHSSIDLHWNVILERRAKLNVVDAFLAARVNVNGFYSLKTEDQLFIMLVHPVFAKYLTAPHARLANVFDLYQWMAKHEIDWDYLVDLLERTHLKTAAWLSGTYGELLTGIPLPPQLLGRIKPSPLKGSYLRLWINRNLSTRLLQFSTLPKLLFTLPAHDSLVDAWAFVLSSLGENKRSGQIMAELEKAIAQPDE